MPLAVRPSMKKGVNGTVYIMTVRTQVNTEGALTQWNIL
jgi:hypothetical protein